jgi:hypothetical protein
MEILKMCQIRPFVGQEVGISFKNIKFINNGKFKKNLQLKIGYIGSDISIFKPGHYQSRLFSLQKMQI